MHHSPPVWDMGAVSVAVLANSATIGPIFGSSR